MLTTREVLLRTAAYIDQHGIRKDGRRGVTGQACSVVGAMDVVSGHCSDDARAELLRHLGKPVSGSRAINGLVIDTWGRAEERTATEVSAALRAAAEGLP